MPPPGLSRPIWSRKSWPELLPNSEFPLLLVALFYTLPIESFREQPRQLPSLSRLAVDAVIAVLALRSAKQRLGTHLGFPHLRSRRPLNCLIPSAPAAYPM